jgi:hypothetical protein
MLPLAPEAKRTIRSDYDITDPGPGIVRKLAEALIKGMHACDCQTVSELYDTLGDLIANRLARPYRTITVIQRGSQVVGIRGPAGTRVIVKRYAEDGPLTDSGGRHFRIAWRKRDA